MPIYLDHAATTPLRREALEAMLPYLTDQFGNASSQHSFGRRARAGLDEAHEKIARTLGATPREIVLTSGGTEANNLAIKGAAWAGKARGHRIVTTSVEHHSVGHTVRYLEKFGFELVELPVDRYGQVDPEQVEAAITPKTILVSVMWANNEVGTIQLIAEIAQRVRRHKGVLFHTDAVQAAPYLDLHVSGLDVDLLTISAHKFEGPKGVGALYVRHGTNILAQQQGGPQERYRRAGTEDVAGAVGMAAALELAASERAETASRLRTLRDRLIAALSSIDGLESSGHQLDRLPGHASFIVGGVDGSALTMAMDLAGLAASTGSACVSGSNEVSHVLTAMGYPADEAGGALRLSLGRTTTSGEIDAAARLIADTVASQREAAERLEASRAAALATLSTPGASGLPAEAVAEEAAAGATGVATTGETTGSRATAGAGAGTARE
jgi:cysteine desulfurase